MQSRKMSLIELIFNLSLGYVMSIMVFYFLIPVFGMKTNINDSMIITMIFTILSLIRGYFVRRLFNLIFIKYEKMSSDIQTKRMSLIETIFNVFLGYLISTVILHNLLPLFGIDIKLEQSLIMVSVFTFLSLIRGYYVRRLFNHSFFSKF